MELATSITRGAIVPTNYMCEPVSYSTLHAVLVFRKPFANPKDRLTNNHVIVSILDYIPLI